MADETSRDLGAMVATNTFRADLYYRLNYKRLLSPRCVSAVDVGFHLSAGELIEPSDFAEELESVARIGQLNKVPVIARDASLSRMIDHGESFWSVVYAPYMSRERSREEVRGVIAEGLARARGNYKRLLPLFGIEAVDYLKFMDFLRHQRLKPD